MDIFDYLELIPFKNVMNTAQLESSMSHLLNLIKERGIVFVNVDGKEIKFSK